MTHISYKVSKMLKEFLGESAPEPTDTAYWVTHQYTRDIFMAHKNDGAQVDYIAPAYQLHDLLSKPFCEAMAKTKCMTLFADGSCPWSWGSYYDRLSMENKDGGLPAVEKALCEMMEAK